MPLLNHSLWPKDLEALDNSKVFYKWWWVTWFSMSTNAHESVAQSVWWGLLWSRHSCQWHGLAFVLGDLPMRAPPKCLWSCELNIQSLMNQKKYCSFVPPSKSCLPLNKLASEPESSIVLCLSSLCENDHSDKEWVIDDKQWLQRRWLVMKGDENADDEDDVGVNDLWLIKSVSLTNCAPSSISCIYPDHSLPTKKYHKNSWRTWNKNHHNQFPSLI